MITVMEVWQLQARFSGQALELMQEMDDMLGPPAHAHPGWCGHARFYQSVADPSRVVMIYPWSSREHHETLVAREEAPLRDFVARYCAARREIHYYNELPVDVERNEMAGPMGQAEARRG
jgi:hypothetical protein